MSDNVSEDNLLQIFKWLPVKTLLRFRCVCKWWKAMIDSDSFMQDHLSVQKPRFIADYEVPNEFLVLDPLTPPFVDTLTAPIRDEPELNLRLLGTLNGVVCVSANKSEYLLWNPSIRKFLSIPLPEFIDLELINFESDNGDDNDVEVYTVSSFFANSTFSGFWIDPSTKEFKIITAKALKVNEWCEIPLHSVLYSLVVEDWVVIRDPDQVFNDCKPMASTPVAMIEGVAYWRAYIDRTDSDNEEPEPLERAEAAILSFDFVQERFEYAGVPDILYSGYFQPVLCKLQGQLSLVYWDSEFPYRCHIYMWFGDIWVEMFSFTLFPARIFYVCCVLDDLEDSCKVLAIDRNGRDLVLYDSEDGIVTLRSGIGSPIMYFVYDFVESLLFP